MSEARKDVLLLDLRDDLEREERRKFQVIPPSISYANAEVAHLSSLPQLRGSRSALGIPKRPFSRINLNSV